MKIESQEISLPILKEKDVCLFVKRLDKIHPFISGNKWFKLKYNLIEAKKLGHDTLLTFGGAYSNHIAATAFSAKEKRFKSIGIIRGEEHLPLNPTLRFARENGMELHLKVPLHNFLQ
jgi:1-aminocyclopropane-1-carboxylate deaminase/D-cysteine desulfhydrase-like pyridoxal-dependent ACC family enzyme